MINRKLNLVLQGVTASLLILSHSTAMAQNLIGPVGSSSGGTADYSISCPDGEYLVGLDLRTGWYVDNIGLICARFDAGGNMITDTFDDNGDGNADVDDSVVTGGGTASTTLLCPNNSVINQFGGRDGAYVDALGARCVNTDGTGDAGGLNITGGGGGNLFNLFCPDGEAATGISGRSGWWIDSAEFVCEQLCLDTPPQVSLQSPQDGGEPPAANTVTFTWTTPGTGTLLGQVFQLCISSDPANACDIFSLATGSTTANIPTSQFDFSNNAPVFWAVRAVNNCGEPGAFTDAFAINPPGQGIVNPIAGIDYRPLCAVYKDDRCSICHGGPEPAGHPVPFPGQNDAEGRFDDDGCNGCHFVVHPENNQNVWEFPPGAAEEELGVDLQTFADPATCGDICRTVRNWAEQHDFIHHVEVDPLVRYGFEPQTAQGDAAGALNARPPVAEMSHAEFISLSESWYRAGMPCDPIENNFPSGTAVSSAGAPGGNGGNGGVTGDGFDTSILDKLVTPPEGKTLWWITPSGKPIKSNKPTRTGQMPVECLALIRQPGRPIPVTKSATRAGKTDQGRRHLEKVCRELLKGPATPAAQ